MGFCASAASVGKRIVMVPARWAAVGRKWSNPRKALKTVSEGQCSFYLFYSCYFTVKQVIDVATVVIIFAVYMQVPALFNYRQTQRHEPSEPPNPAPRGLCGGGDSQLLPGTARVDPMVRDGAVFCALMVWKNDSNSFTTKTWFSCVQNQ